MTKYVSYIFDSDRQFKGWIIKNPNCVYMTKTYWYNDTVSCLELANSLRNAYKGNFNTPIFVRNVDETISKIEMPINGNVKINSYVDERSSRNCCLLKELREWLVSYDKENGELPEQKAINQKAYEISTVLGKLTQKGTLPKSEIDKVVKSVVKFVRENKNERCYSQKQRFGNLVRGSERELNILDVYAFMKQGYKRKVIQEGIER